MTYDTSGVSHYDLIDLDTTERYTIQLNAMLLQALLALVHLRTITILQIDKRAPPTMAIAAAAAASHCSPTVENRCLKCYFIFVYNSRLSLINNWSFDECHLCVERNKIR